MYLERAGAWWREEGHAVVFLDRLDLLRRFVVLRLQLVHATELHETLELVTLVAGVADVSEELELACVASVLDETVLGA